MGYHRRRKARKNRLLLDTLSQLMTSSEELLLALDFPYIENSHQRCAECHDGKISQKLVSIIDTYF